MFFFFFSKDQSHPRSNHGCHPSMSVTSKGGDVEGKKKRTKKKLIFCSWLNAERGRGQHRASSSLPVKKVWRAHVERCPLLWKNELKGKITRPVLCRPQRGQGKISEDGE